MATINYKSLNANIVSMLSNCIEATQYQAQDHTAAIAILGKGSGVQFRSPNQQPPVEFQANDLLTPHPTVYVVGEGVAAFQNFITSVRKDDRIADKVSDVAIQQAAYALVLDCKFDKQFTPAKIDKRIKDLLTFLAGTKIIWDTFTPIDNLHIRGMPDLTVGKISFRPSAIVEHEIRARLNIRAAQRQSDSQTSMADYFDVIFAPVFRSAAACAVMNAECEENQLQNLVDAEVDASLNLMRCYTSILYSREARAFIGLRGDIIKEVPRPTIGLGPMPNYPTFMTIRKVGAFFEYVVTPEAVAHLKQEFTFDELSNVLSKAAEHRTKLETIIVTAIRWLGRGVAATDIPERVLSLTIALERMLMEKETAEIGDKLARRLAYLLSVDKEQRTIIYDRAKHLYNLRSRVVHEGRLDIDTNQIDELEAFALGALVAMARHLSEWTDISQFAKWVKAKEFG